MIWKRIRGTLGMATFWGLTWGIFGAAWTTTQVWWARRYTPALHNLSLLDVISWMLVFWGVLGFLSGAIFAVLIARLERRRSVDDLTLRRVAIWGALGGASLPLLASTIRALSSHTPSDWLSAPLIAGTLGAICATMSVRLAQRASVSTPTTTTDTSDCAS